MDVNIPTTIKDPATRRFIKELQDRVTALEGNS